MIPTTLDRVGVVMMSAVGDAVHVLPVINAIKRHRPTSHVTWVLQPVPASLVRGHRAIDEILLFDKGGGLRAFLNLRREVREPFDVLLCLQVYLKAGLVQAMLPARVKLGFDRDRARDLNWLITTHRIPAHAPQHVQDQYLEFLDALGIPCHPLVWDLGPWPEERKTQRRFFDTLERPAAALAISSSDPEREWPVERWSVLCDALWSEYGLQPVAVGGSSAREQALLKEIQRRASCPIRSTLGVSLRELVGVLDGAALSIAINSAPLHIACALNRPVVSLLGHWNPKRTGPYRFHELRVDGYGNPGEDYPISIERRPGTMRRVDVRAVLEKLELWRQRYGVGWRADSASKFNAK